LVYLCEICGVVAKLFTRMWFVFCHIELSCLN
jgi:hypothetical protein